MLIGRTEITCRPAFSPDSTLVVIGNPEGRVVLRETGTWKPLVQVPVKALNQYQRPEVMQVAWSPCGQYIVTCEAAQLASSSKS